MCRGCNIMPQLPTESIFVRKTLNHSRMNLCLLRHPHSVENEQTWHENLLPESMTLCISWLAFDNQSNLLDVDTVLSATEEKGGSNQWMHGDGDRNPTYDAAKAHGKELITEVWVQAPGRLRTRHVNGGKLVALPICRPSRSVGAADLTEGKDFLADILVSCNKR